MVPLGASKGHSLSVFDYHTFAKVILYMYTILNKAKNALNILVMAVVCGGNI